MNHESGSRSARMNLGRLRQAIRPVTYGQSEAAEERTRR